MKFKYNIKEIVRALSRDDLMGLLHLMEDYEFLETKPAIVEMENRFIELFPTLNIDTQKQIENLMLSCARFNSIGF